MKNSFRRAIWFACCAAGALSILSGRGFAQVQAQKGVEANAKTFDLNLFEQNIKKAVDGQTIGYSYAINVTGQLKKKGAYGYAVLSQDMPKGDLFYGPKDEPRNGMTSCIMNYPNGVQVALLVNALGTYKRADALLVEAFDNAWVVKGKAIEP